jgi:magnesium chelatase subunit D
VVEASETFEPRALDTPLDEMVRKQGGRRSQTKSKNKRGRYIQSKPSPNDAGDLAFDATVRAAAPYQGTREDIKQENDVAFAIRGGDFQKKVRVKKTANLILFLVDGSWSMAVAERMQATKAAILSLLTDAYQRRDRVGLVVFQKDRATLVLAPTNSVLLAQRALASIPVGGKTPLAAGLQMAYEVIKREKTLHPDVQPLLIVLTDGAGNVAIGKRPVQVEIDELAALFQAEKIHSVVINMEQKIFDQGLAKDLAEKMGAVCYTIEDLKGETLYQTVQKEMTVPAGVISRGAGL